jgi:hypothetical protein
MTMVPSLSPQLPIVDRNAETNVAGPESVATPQHDTVLLAPAPPPVAAQPSILPHAPPQAERGVSTFGAQTTDAPAGTRQTRAVAIIAVGLAAALVIGVGAFLALRHRPEPQDTAPASPPVTTPATAPTPTVNITPAPIETMPAISASHLASAPIETTPAISASHLARAPKPTPAPAATTATATGRPRPSASAVSPAPAPTQTTKKDPLHVGSGL